MKCPIMPKLALSPKLLAKATSNAWSKAIQSHGGGLKMLASIGDNSAFSPQTAKSMGQAVKFNSKKLLKTNPRLPKSSNLYKRLKGQSISNSNVLARKTNDAVNNANIRLMRELP